MASAKSAFAIVRLSISEISGSLRIIAATAFSGSVSELASVRLFSSRLR